MSTLFKKIILVFVIALIAIIALFYTCSGGSSKKERTKTEIKKASKETSEVYICNSESGKHYHSDKNCQGLNRCTHDIIKISLKEAKERKLDKCSECY